MLKVDPKFKFDRSYRGPYCVHGVTATSVRIQPINKPDEEVICVSLQRLSRCTGVSLDSVRPWLGHRKVRRRRKLRRRTVPTNQSMAEEQDQQSSSQQDTSQNEDDCLRTKSGQKVKKLQRYCLKSSFPDRKGRRVYQFSTSWQWPLHCTNKSLFKNSREATSIPSLFP